MHWPMFEIFYSEGTDLIRGPRFRLVSDAMAHAKRHLAGRSFAILAPDGEWYVDERGTSVFGEDGPPPRAETAAPQAVIDDEITRPFGTGSGSHPTVGQRAPRITTRYPDIRAEKTQTRWPPLN